MKEEQMINGLPKDWKWVKLGEVLTVSSGKGIKVNSLKGGNYSVYGGNGFNGLHSEYFLEEPRLIIGRVGVKCGVMHITKPKSWVTDNALIVQPKIDAFDIRFLKLKLGYENLNKLSVSTAQPVISGRTIYAYEISLPPKETQQQIVSKIEELFSELDKGIEELKTAQQQLKVYRQAVLKWAFEGKLNELPNETFCTIGYVVNMQSGVAFKKSEYAKEGVRLFQIANVSFNYIKWEEIEYLPDIYLDEYPELRINEGDIVMALNRPLLNDNLKIAQIKKSDTPAILYQRVGRFKFLKDDDRLYFLYFLQSPGFLQWLKAQLQGVNIPFINKSKLMGFDRYPMRLLEEQQQIVQEIESRLSVCDKIEETITASLKQAEALRQSILKKAFEGKLID